MAALADELVADPPPEALAWLTTAVGPGARVVSIEPLDGARSSAVHRIGVELRRGRVEELVLRRHVDRDWLRREPALAEREAEALELLAGAAVPVPRLIGLDATGADAGAPAVLMSWLPGRPCSTSELPERLSALARLLPQVHATSTAAAPDLRRYRPYFTGGIDPREADLAPPPWSRRPRLWDRAIEVHRAWVTPADGVLLHRDYHPGNVLFVDRRPSGLVDWVNACLGPADLDVGHCRLNLAALLDLTAADRFRDLWLTEAGVGRYDATGDVLAVVGCLPEWPWSPSGAAARLEELVARALAELGAT
jgi:aminoglycoside phosphotransferase (APT) family kinase protein